MLGHVSRPSLELQGSRKIRRERRPLQFFVGKKPDAAALVDDPHLLGVCLAAAYETTSAGDDTGG